LKVTLTYNEELGVRIADNGVGIDPLMADSARMATSVCGECVNVLPVSPVS
jgi:hypothetical protein